MNELTDEWMNDNCISNDKEKWYKKKQTKIFQALVIFAALVSGKSLSSE